VFLGLGVGGERIVGTLFIRQPGIYMERSFGWLS
jgi:hypothetical protein